MKEASEINLAVINRPRSAEAEAYRTLRTNLGFASPDEQCRSILITSPDQADGKSTVAANLAAVLAQAENRVVLVDCDLRRSCIHQIFGTDNYRGFSNWLLKDHNPDEMIRKTAVENLFLLTSGPPPSNPAELLGTKQAGGLLQALRDRFDYVIIDSPPILAVTDAVLLSPQVDGVLMVLGAGKTRRPQAQEAHKRLRTANANVLGLVMNRIPMDHRAYNKYYQ